MINPKHINKIKPGLIKHLILKAQQRYDSRINVCYDIRDYLIDRGFLFTSSEVSNMTEYYFSVKNEKLRDNKLRAEYGLKPL